MLSVPSGRVFDDQDIELAKEMAEGGFIARSEKPFRLKSGIESHIYVYGREDLSDNPRLEWLIGRKIAWTVRMVIDATHKWYKHADLPIPCLIGVPTAGTVLAQAAAMVNYRERIFYHKYGYCSIQHRLMREMKKGHGAHQTWVNGRPDLVKHQYWMVDNVATDSASKLEAAAKLAEDGYPAKEMPCLIFVDRQQGALKRLEREGFRQAVVVFNLLDLTYVFGELGIWPKKTVRQVEEEITAHQLNV